MKIVALVNCYNSEEYIEYCIKSIYPYVEQIIIIDGAFNDKIQPTISNDKTEEIIKRIMDKEYPGGKITYVREGGNNEVEQRNKVFRYIDLYTMDWLFIVDDDEIYKPEDLLSLREFLEYADKDGYYVHSFDFINSFDWYKDNSHRRIYRIDPSMKFSGIIKVSYGNKEYEVKEFIPNINKFHYSYVHNEMRAQMKTIEISHDFPWKIEGRIFKRKGLKLKKFEGEHPEIMHNHPYRRFKWQPNS